MPAVVKVSCPGHKEQVYGLTKPETVVGRSARSDIHLDDLRVSRLHALIIVDYLAGRDPAMTAVRRHCDGLEGMVDDALWPLPKYRELLMVH